MKVDNTKGFVWTQTVKSRGRSYPKDYKDRIIVQKWPKPRGNKKTVLQQAWVNHFSCIADVFKDFEPLQYDMANRLRPGSRWLARDVFYAAAHGQLFLGPGERKVNTPTAMVYRTAGESLTSGVKKVLTPNAIFWDNNRFWNDPANPTRMIIRSPGLYLVGAWTKYSGSTAGYQRSEIVVNGTTIIAQPYTPSTTNNTADQDFAKPWYFETGHYFEVTAITNQSGKNVQLMQMWAVAITPENVHDG